MLTLISERIGESRTLDYKRDWLSLNDSGLPQSKILERKLELLQDISAFANTAGGVIVYGVETQRLGNNEVGIPVDICGVSNHNWAAIRLQLSELVRDHLRPQFVGLDLQAIELPTGKTVVILGVIASPAMPHMVWLNKNGRVWRRSEGGRYQADMEEISRMIQERSSARAEIDAFRSSRRDWARQIGFETKYTLVQVVPVGRMDRIKDLRQHMQAVGSLAPFGTHDDPRFNFDGIVVDGYRTGGEAVRSAHLQWFRHGGFELLTAQYHHDSPAQPTFSAYGLTRLVHEYLPTLLGFMVESLECDPPFALLITLSGLKHRIIDDAPRQSVFPWGAPRPFDVDLLGLPGLQLDAITDDFSHVVQPLLDVLWQSAGYWQAPPPPST